VHSSAAPGADARAKPSQAPGLQALHTRSRLLCSHATTPHSGAARRACGRAAYVAFAVVPLLSSDAWRASRARMRIGLRLDFSSFSFSTLESFSMRMSSMWLGEHM
jgi:hypothetical protein